MPRRKLGYRIVRCPESLENRTMLSGSGVMPFAHVGHQMAESGARQPATQFVSSAIAGQSASGGITCESHGSQDSRGDTSQEDTSQSDSTQSDTMQTSFTASLTDPNNSTATGTANYTTSTADGTTAANFAVNVSGAAANTTFDVAVGDTIVGRLTTDDTGAGELLLSNNPTGSEQQLPADFPADISADAVVTVGTLTGTLAADTSTGGDTGTEGDSGTDGDTNTGNGCHSSAATSLTSSLTDQSSTATGSASYQTDNSTGETTFFVSITGAAADSTFDVAIDDTAVGQLTTDSTGAGTLEFSSNPAGTQQALPLDFPTNISAGSTVTVGTLTGTFTTETDGAYSVASVFGGHHFSRRR